MLKLCRDTKVKDYTCLDLDYSGYHKNLIQLLFIILIKSQDEVTNYETARDNILSF